MAKQAQQQQGMSFTSAVVVLLIVIGMAGAAKEGAFNGIGKGGSGDSDSNTYRYDCNFEDFYGGVEMESWQGSGRHHQDASPDPFGALSRSAGTQPKGISLHVKARALTPVAPLPRGAKPRLECKIVRVSSTGREKVIAGPKHISSRTVWLQVDARAS